MTREEEEPITSRLPKSLIAELEAIAEDVHRSRSKTLALLLKRGIEVFRQDGLLIDTRLRNSSELLGNQDSAPTLFMHSDGTGTAPKGKTSTAARKDAEDIKTDARARISKKKAEQGKKKS